jgi:hypothetical protein
MKLDANICNPETSSSGNQFPSTTYIHIYIPGGKKKKHNKTNKPTNCKPLSKRRIEKAKGNETGYNISNPKTSLSGNESTLHSIHTYIHTWRKEAKSKTKQNQTKRNLKKKQEKTS